MAEAPLVVGLGELLWDVFPDSKQLGGAPANFAYHSALLGARAVVASRVGDDALGAEARERLRDAGLDTRCVQTDPVHATGTVVVRVDDGGQPQFTCSENVAWDHLEFTPEWRELAAQADVVCFGTLAQRGAASRQTIRAFLDATRPESLRVFDANLRQHFYSADILGDSLRRSTILKLNEDEAPRLARTLGYVGRGTAPVNGVDVSFARALIGQFGLRLVCVTRGANGSVLVTREEVSEHPGFRVQVADTVGAGDAFTAALAHYFAAGAPLDKVNAAANWLGSWVASKRGAMPGKAEEVIVGLEKLVAASS
jgi:fructokinase